MKLLESRGAAWLDAATHRRSYRHYDGEPVDDAALRALGSTCAELQLYPETRVVVVRDAPQELFTGIVGSYGRIVGAPHALAFLVDANADHRALRRAGYVGEAAILEATALGLETCWVGGFFNPRVVSAVIDIGTSERAVAVSPLGHAMATPDITDRMFRRMARSHTRKSIEKIAPGIDTTWPDWVRAAVECARNAPSAMNRQPWRFRLDGPALVVSQNSRAETPRVTKALDCGIATLHAEIAALAHGVTGEWLDVDQGLDIARFVADDTREASPQE